MKIEVLGSGCMACEKLHEVVQKVVKEENINADVEYSEDITRIVELGYMKSPLLVVDCKVVDLKSLKDTDVKDAILNSGDCECGGNCSCNGSCC
jgi:hypothetical protein